MNHPLYEESVKFHGHSCPGLAIGYRVAMIAMREVADEKSNDEELVAVVENKACGFDAIQYICGCTMGKGNIILNDYGKHVYTFFNRVSGKNIRIYIDPYMMPGIDSDRFFELRKKGNLTEDEAGESGTIKKEWIEKILSAPEKDFISCGPAKITLPEKALVLDSSVCTICNEKAMSSMVKEINSKKICIPCLKGQEQTHI